jgi:hypothetical protein
MADMPNEPGFKSSFVTPNGVPPVPPPAGPDTPSYLGESIAEIEKWNKGKAFSELQPEDKTMAVTSLEATRLFRGQVPDDQRAEKISELRTNLSALTTENPRDAVQMSLSILGTNPPPQPDVQAMAAESLKESLSVYAQASPSDAKRYAEIALRTHQGDAAVENAIKSVPGLENTYPMGVPPPAAPGDKSAYLGESTKAIEREAMAPFEKLETYQKTSAAIGLEIDRLREGLVPSGERAEKLQEVQKNLGQLFEERPSLAVAQAGYSLINSGQDDLKEAMVASMKDMVTASMKADPKAGKTFAADLLAKYGESEDDPLTKAIRSVPGLENLQPEARKPEQAQPTSITGPAVEVTPAAVVPGKLTPPETGPKQPVEPPDPGPGTNPEGEAGSKFLSKKEADRLRKAHQTINDHLGIRGVDQSHVAVHDAELDDKKNLKITLANKHQLICGKNDDGDYISMGGGANDKMTAKDAEAMISLAKTRGWKSIKINGNNEEEKAMIALEAEKQGVKVDNPPSQAVMDKVRKKMEKEAGPTRPGVHMGGEQPAVGEEATQGPPPVPPAKAGEPSYLGESKSAIETLTKKKFDELSEPQKLAAVVGLEINRLEGGGVPAAKRADALHELEGNMQHLVATAPSYAIAMGAGMVAGAKDPETMAAAQNGLKGALTAFAKTNPDAAREMATGLAANYGALAPDVVKTIQSVPGFEDIKGPAPVKGGGPAPNRPANTGPAAAA